MKKKRLILWVSIILVLVVLTCFSGIALAETPPDIIHSYVVTIDPQPDGSLKMNYVFNYEATTDFPSNIQYLEIGVPNTNFEIVDYGPKTLVKDAVKISSGKSQVHLDFNQLPKKGDRFSLNFDIIQKSMVYETSSKDILGFKFVPGWFDFAVIDELKVVINTKNLSEVKFEPDPASNENQTLIWITKNMKVNQKAEPVKVQFLAVSLPQIDKTNMGSESDSSDMGLFWIIILGVLVIVIIIVVAIAIFDGGDGYSGGSYGGGYHGGGFFGGGLSSGGGGSFSGRGSSCASSCACACACAGGGRVGCSERGIQITHWLVKSKKDQKEGDKSDQKNNHLPFGNGS